MTHSATHSCPNCEYERGNAGKPVIAGDRVECLVCGTSWKEFSGGSGKEVSTAHRSSQIAALRKLAARGDKDTSMRARMSVQSKPAQKLTFQLAGLAAALMIGVVGLSAYAITAFEDHQELPLDRMTVSSVRFKENISADGRKVITVRGDINNPTPNGHAIPKVAIILKRKDGGEIIRWRYHPPQRIIDPGGKTQFASSIQYDTPVVAYAEAIIE